MAKMETTAPAPLRPDKRPNRVLLPTQRVKPTTIAKLHRMRTKHRGLGRAIDYSVEAAAE